MLYYEKNYKIFSLAEHNIEIKIINLFPGSASKIIELLYENFSSDFIFLFGRNKSCIKKGKKIFTEKYGMFTKGVFIAINSITGELVGLAENSIKDKLTRKRDLGFIEIFKAFGFYGLRVFLANLFEREIIDDNECYLKFLAVNEKYRRQGIAQRLLGESFKFALENKKEYLTLWVEKNNPAYDLYTKSGFKKIKEEKSNIIERLLGDNETCFFMKKQVKTLK
jgi:ribosomal protein S18 acetylase RimI-like enzyme